MAGNLPKVGVEMVAENSATFLRAMDDGTRAVNGFGGNLTSTAPKFSAFEQVAAGAFQRVGHMVTNFAVDAGAALLGFGADAITLAGDYESTLNRFSSVTGASLEEAGYEVDDFSQLFLKLGADTQFSAQQAADAGVELAKGGVPIEQIMGDATEATLALAAAGELELAPAAEIVAKQLGVWGDRGVTATQAADLLAQAANASTVDVDELALGLANVGGTAKTAGVSFQDTVQTMALLAPGFSSASDAGTSFKTFLSRLIPTTDNAIVMMEDLGLYTEEAGSKFYDASGSFVGMEKASQLLYESTKDLSEEQRLLAFQTIFGADAIRAAAIISEQGAAGFNKMGDSMTKAGSASAQAAERNKGFNFALESLKGSLETIQIIVGTAVLPVLTSFINDVLIPGSNAVMEFVTALGSSSDPLGMLGNMASSAAGLIAAGLPMIRQAFLDWALAAAMWVVDALPMLLDGLAQFYQGAADWAVGAAIQFGEQMLAFGQAAVAWITPQLPMLSEQLGQFFNRMVTWIVDSLPGWAEKLGAFGEKAIAWVQAALPGLAQNLGLFAGNLLAWIVRTIGDITPKLAEMAGKFISWIWTDVLPELPGAAMQIWNALNTFISTAASLAVAELAKLGAKFNEWVAVDVLPILPDKLMAIWDAISGWVTGILGNVKNKLAEIGKAMIDGILSGLGGLADALLGDLIDGISSALDGVKNFFGISSPSKMFYDEVGIWLVPGITNAVVDTMPALTDALVGGIDTAMLAGDLAADMGGDAINATLGAQLATASATISQLQAAMAEAQALSSQVGGMFSGAGGSMIRPPMGAGGGLGGNISNVSNGPTISYSPTYNAPAPPPAMSYAALRTMAGS